MYRYICSLNVQIGIYDKNVSFYKGSEEEREPADGEGNDKGLS